MEINWSLLGQPVDVGAAVNAGYQRGRALRHQGEQESAFARLARNPNDPEGIAMLVASGDPQTAWAFKDHARADRRLDYARSAFGGAPAPTTLPGAGAAPSAFSPSIASPAPATATPGATTTAPASPQPPAPAAASAASVTPGQLNPETMRQFFAEDPDGARELLTSWNSLNAAQRAEQTRRFSAAVPVLAELAHMPLEQRAAAVAAQHDYLVQNGWTAEQIQNFAADPNDESIRMLLRMGVPIAEQHSFFAPVEGGPGQVYRDPFTLNVNAANPSPARDEHSYDASGNEIITTIPGTPAIGPGANLFGTMQPSERSGSLAPPPRPGAGAPMGPVNIEQAATVGHQFGTVTSTRRSPEHNREVGGSPTSFHLVGRAIDIARRRGVTHTQVVAGYRAAGYTLHPDTRDEGDHSHIVIASAPGQTRSAAAAPPPGFVMDR